MTSAARLRLVYFAPADIQLARVDRQCIVYFCSALASAGVHVELVALRIAVRPDEPTGDHPLSLYRIRRRFPVRLVRVPVSQESEDWWLAANRMVAHTFHAVRELAHPSQGRLAFYTKTYSSAAMMLALRALTAGRVAVVFEAHVPPGNRFQRQVLSRVDRVVANTHALARRLNETGQVRPDRLLGQHQGVDTELTRSLRVPPARARANTGLPLKKKLVVYTGKIYEGYREVEYLLDTARILEHREDVRFVLVGGRADHVRRLAARAAAEGRHNVTFAGFVAPKVVQDYQFSADVLVLYYPSGLELNDYRSPGKLFEYMASGTPIVAVDLPVLREVLGEDDAAAVIVAPDSPDQLAEGIASVLDDPSGARQVAARALERVEDFTWDRRAEAIRTFIGREP